MGDLSAEQLDRAMAVLLGSAVGDALGVPYEFEPRLAEHEVPEMIGGGLGTYAPGEWSDDTSMAVAIAEAAATGVDLASDEGLDLIASGFLRWYLYFDADPPDIGDQTRAVLDATSRRTAVGAVGIGAVMTEESLRFSEMHPHSAGNGALMRTSPVALAHLGDRDALAEAARAVATLTHADPLAGDSCVLWCEAIRVAVLHGNIDIEAGLDLIPTDRQEQWKDWLVEANNSHPNEFHPNRFTVHALQAAAAAITYTAVPADDPTRHFLESLHTAIRIGDDTDTVAAIAGGLLGARWGTAPLAEYRDKVNGWPFVDGKRTVAADLARLTEAIVG